MWRRRQELALFASVAICSLNLASWAQEPTMEVTWTNFLADYDNLHPGLESVFRYTIRNTSAPGPTNNLVSLTLPTGIAAGLFYVWPDQFPYDWQAWFGSDATYLTSTNHPVSPGGTITWEVRANSLVSRPGYITAWAAGATTAVPFAPVLVQAPAAPYPPPSLANLTVSGNAASLTALDLLWNQSYTLERSTTLCDWTNVLAFQLDVPSTTNSKVLSFLLPTNVPMQFFRIRSP